MQKDILYFLGKFKDFVESDGFGTFTWKDGTIYFGPMLEGSFDTTGAFFYMQHRIIVYGKLL